MLEDIRYRLRGLPWFADLAGDMRYAMRAVRKNPGFAATAILTLALGVGANTAVFSVVNTVLVKPLPYPDPDRIVLLMTTWRGRGSFPGVSAPKFTEWRRSTDGFQDAAAYRLGGVMNLTRRDQPEQIAAGRVSAAFFRLFGARVAQGRTFTTEEDQPNGPHVVVISDGFWQRQMGAAPDVSGQTLSLDGDSYTVIGVLEPGFEAVSLSVSVAPPADVWVPLQLDPNSQSDAPFLAAARLRTGITLDVAQAQTDVAASVIRQAFPAVMPSDAGLSVEPLQTVLVRDVRASLLLLLGAVGFVLLIVCTNTANLLLVRASVRQREMAIRLATGASRGRLARQLLTESLVLSVSGGTLGFLFALAGMRTVLAVGSGDIPRIVAHSSAYTVDWRVLAFTLIVSIATGIAFGLVPALHASRVDLDATLRGGSDRVGSGPGHSRLRALLVISEVALALMLLVGSALLVRSFVTLRGVNPGFDTHGILTMQMAITGERFATIAGTSQVLRDGLQGVGAVPGVEVAAATLTGAPLSGSLSFLNITIPGRSLDGPYYAGGYLGGWQVISPHYFDVFKIPVVAGRIFTERDRRGTPLVVIINQAMARQFWPTESPLDHHILIGQGAGPDYEETTPRQIVGVVGDVRHVGLQWDPRPTAYVPVTQMADNQIAFLNRIGGRLTWIVRAREESYRLVQPIQHELGQASGGLPLAEIRSMNELSSASTARTQFEMWLMAIFSGSALLLAALGVFGVMTYTVRQRSREIGIRVALGAGPHRVRNMVLIHGMRLALCGVAIGMASAFGLARLISGLLFGVSPHDRMVFISMPLLLGVVAFAAVWLPARRAAAVDPAIALRHDG
jgi:predicted permease